MIRLIDTIQKGEVMKWKYIKKKTQRKPLRLYPYGSDEIFRNQQKNVLSIHQDLDELNRHFDHLHVVQSVQLRNQRLH